jgi:MFS transporter, PPP family, 3-phenylpropionic acid transporter
VVNSLVIARRRSLPVDSSIVRPAIVYAALFGAVGTFYPYSSVLLASRGLDFGAIGVLLALHGVVGLLAAPAWGAVADHVGAVHRVLLATSLIAVLGATALALTTEPLGIAVALAVLAVGTGGMIPLADTRAVEMAGESRERFSKGRAWGSAGFIVATVVTGAMLSNRGPDALFLLSIPLLLVTGLTAWRLLAPDPTRGRRPARTSVRFGAGLARLIRLPGLSALLVGVTLIWTAIGAVMTFISIHVASLGADLGTVGFMWAFGAAVEIPIMLAFPALARRVGSERLLILGALAFAGRAAGWGLASDPIVAVLVAPLGGIGFALFYIGLVTFIARAVPHEAQATAQGVYSGMTFSLGSVIGALVAGVLAPIVGLPGLFLASAVATVLGAFIVARAIAASRPAPA